MPRTPLDPAMSNRKDTRKRASSSRQMPSKLDINYLLNFRPSDSSKNLNPSHPSSSSSQKHPVSSPIHSTTIHESINRESEDFPILPMPVPAVHDFTKRKSKDRPHKCETCGFSFGQRSDRNKHVRTVHLRQRPFSCFYCSQTFGEKGNL